MTSYQISKSVLKCIAYDARSKYRNDLPKIRQVINDSMDAIGRDCKLTEHEMDSLANYACKLHPEN
jgi:hypothetical protein